MRSVCQKKSRPKKTHTYVERIARLYYKKTRAAARFHDYL